MAATKTLVSLLLCVVACFVDGLIPPMTKGPLRRSSQRLASTSGLSDHSTFEQLIDHSNPSLGTFSQFYYYSAKHWAGPGSPVILTTPGEVSARGYDVYFDDNDIYEDFAEAIGGAVIIIEHRYWGASSPFQNLTDENLQYLTLDNAIADLTNFANNVILPFDLQRTSQPSKAPWVLAGVSYAGALSAWTAILAPGTFWAYHASSAPVEAIYDFWDYFRPMAEYMPPTCFDGVSLVTKHVDEVLNGGNETEVTSLKTLFGLQDLTIDGDFASALYIPMDYLWQTNLPAFDVFCQWIEAGGNPSTDHQPLANGGTIQLDRALNGYAEYIRAKVVHDFCNYIYRGEYKNGSVACFQSGDPNASIYTDTSVSNPYDRQWVWMLCNQPFGWWQAAGPAGTGSGAIISKSLSADYFQNQCQLYFPQKTFGSANGKTAQQLNAYTGGWSANQTTRLLYVNGQWDPWREAGVSADIRPGGPQKSTDQVPIFLIPQGDHGGDLYVFYQGTPSQKAVATKEIKQIQEWVNMYPAQGYHKPTLPPGLAKQNGASSVFDHSVLARCIVSAFFIATITLF